MDDVVLDNCCWGAKTVFASSNIERQQTVRLISGRNSPTYSYGVDKLTGEEGDEKSSGKHKFTWQPSGSQFTIIEDIPEKRLHISVKKPEKVAKEKILEAVNFDSSWYRIVSDHIEKKAKEGTPKK